MDICFDRGSRILLLAVPHAGGTLLPQQARIAELEGAVEALHAHIRSLEEELRARGPQEEAQVRMGREQGLDIRHGWSAERLLGLPVLCIASRAQL